MLTAFRRLKEERLRYWRSLPLPALLRVMLALGLTYASTTFASDLMEALQRPYWVVLTNAAFTSVVTASILFTVIRKPKALFVMIPVALVLSGALLRFGARSSDPNSPLHRMLTSPGLGDLRSRMAMDGTLSAAFTLTGLLIFLSFIVTQGVRHIRVRTELELAEQLQQTLAPPLAFRNAGYEVHGRSAPSSQMGGDLLDTVVIADVTHDVGGESVACYVADVAGHGIQAGVFMGMVKIAARTALLRPGSLEELFTDLNRVVFDVKAGSPTYVTFACLRCHDGGKVEYSLAGNGPILHYHARSKTASLLEMEQFPLGLFARATFQSCLVEVEPGDILALLTDGLPEVVDANDEQFGMERIGQIVARNADRPLAELTDKLFAAARQHGSPSDDETLVLVRRSYQLTAVSYQLSEAPGVADG